MKNMQSSLWYKRGMSAHPLRHSAIAIALLAALPSCKDDKPVDKGAPPPPSASAAAPGACAAGGGQVGDPVSQDFFPRTVLRYCIDPQGDTKTYGEKGKLSMDEVCTTAFDGECEVYKTFGLKRVVSLRYVDGAGGGGSVEVILSQFADAGGGYGMFTKRVIADADPAGAQAPKPIAAGGAGALGSGRGYAWKGAYLVELTYINEQESREEIIHSSEAIVTAVAKEIGQRLPGSADKPAAARALPEANMVPNGIQYFPKNPPGLTNAGPAAIGYYRDGEKRYRLVAIARDDADQAKDTMKAIKGRPGTLPLAQVGDEGAQIVLQAPDRPKAEYLFARRGALVGGITDEELVAADAARLTKDEKTARLRAWLTAAPAPAASAADAGAKAPKK